MYKCDLCGKDVDQLDASLVLKQRPTSVQYDLCQDCANKEREFLSANAKTDLVRSDAAAWDGLPRTGPKAPAMP